MNPEAERQLLDRLRVQREAIEDLRRQQARDVATIADLEVVLSDIRTALEPSADNAATRLGRIRKVLAGADG